MNMNGCVYSTTQIKIPLAAPGAKEAFDYAYFHYINQSLN